MATKKRRPLSLHRPHEECPLTKQKRAAASNKPPPQIWEVANLVAPFLRSPLDLVNFRKASVEVWRAIGKPQADWLMCTILHRYGNTSAREIMATHVKWRGDFRGHFGQLTNNCTRLPCRNPCCAFWGEKANRWFCTQCIGCDADVGWADAVVKKFYSVVWGPPSETIGGRRISEKSVRPPYTGWMSRVLGWACDYRPIVKTDDWSVFCKLLINPDLVCCNDPMYKANLITGIITAAMQFVDFPSCSLGPYVGSPPLDYCDGCLIIPCWEEYGRPLNQISARAFMAIMRAQLATCGSAVPFARVKVTFGNGHPALPQSPFRSIFSDVALVTTIEKNIVIETERRRRLRL